MTTHALPADPPRPPLSVSVARLLADALPQHLYLVGSRFFEVSAAAADGEHVTIELRQFNFHGRDPQLRICLAVSIPDDQEVGPTVETGTGAGIDVALAEELEREASAT